ncbi:MAG: hypothetical protein ACO2O0_02540 [Desulfurococcales archaeon]
MVVKAKRLSSSSLLGYAMDVRRLRVYVAGLLITTLVMSALFGVIFVFIKEISLLYVILIMAALLIVWGVNTYYLVKMIDLEERASPPEAGEG